MDENKILYSTIIKKYSGEQYFPAKISIPKPAIHAFGSKPYFFELRVFSDRIELKSHNFKFIENKDGKKLEKIEKEISDSKEIPELITTPEKEIPASEEKQVPQEEGSKSNIDSINEILNEELISKLEQ